MEVQIANAAETRASDKQFKRKFKIYEGEVGG
jgi:hypothetical protein